MMRGIGGAPIGGGGGGGGSLQYGGGGGGGGGFGPSVGMASTSLASQLEQLLGQGGGGNFPLSSLSALYASGVGGGGGGEFASLYSGGGGGQSLGLHSHLDQSMMSLGSLLGDRQGSGGLLSVGGGEFHPSVPPSSLPATAYLMPGFPPPQQQPQPQQQQGDIFQVCVGMCKAAFGKSCLPNKDVHSWLWVD